MGTKKWHAIPPYYHAWKNRCRILTGGVGEATWDLSLRGQATYTIQAWWAAAPGAKQWTKQAVYKIVADGNVVASRTLDQSEEGDQWHIAIQEAHRPRPALRSIRASRLQQGDLRELQAGGCLVFLSAVGG